MPNLDRLQPRGPDIVDKKVNALKRTTEVAGSARNGDASTITRQMTVDGGNIDVINQGSIRSLGQAPDYMNTLKRVSVSLANRFRRNNNVGGTYLQPGIYMDADGADGDGESAAITTETGNEITARGKADAAIGSINGPSILSRGTFRASNYGASLGASSWDSDIDSNGTAQVGGKANTYVYSQPEELLFGGEDKVNQRYFSISFRMVPDGTGDVLKGSWSSNSGADASIRITNDKRWKLTGTSIDLQSPTNITGLLTAQAITATDLTASGTVQGATVKATGQVQGASAAFTGNVQVGTINGSAYPPPSGGQTLLSPLSPSNWTALGDVFSEVFSTANRVGLSITMRYTGSSTALSTTSYTNIGTVLPSAVRSGSVTSPYLTSGILGGGISTPVVLYVFVNISTGDLQIRPASAVTIANGSLFTLSYLYKLP